MLSLYSGGQTGVDRAALDLALALKMPCGGYCPQGRRAEDGIIPPIYPMQELESADYQARTRQNVLQTDATLIITHKKICGGTALTALFACELGKPCLVIDLQRNPSTAEMKDWLRLNNIAVLNVAGPRESNCPGIYDRVTAWLEPALRELLAGD